MSPDDSIPAIRTAELTKQYDDVIGIDHLTLQVPPGVVFGYLGQNGAGKTTTIRLLAGLLRPSGGQAFVLGMDTWRGADAVHTRIGYLPGDFAPYPNMSGSQYLHYLGSLRGLVERSYVDLLAKRFDVDLDRKIRTLSHGNRQKIGLLQAFMHRPDVLILDEPTAGLDPLMQ